MLPFLTYSTVSEGAHIAGEGLQRGRGEGAGKELVIDRVGASELAARYGTPLYVYAANGFRGNYDRIKEAFGSLKPQICYALKACGNIHILRELVRRGAGLDVVSGGELERAWLSGVDMSKVVFAGVGKTEAELRAALSGRLSLLGASAKNMDGQRAHERAAVGLFNIESEGEILRLATLAKELGVKARACLRINPDVDAHTHAYTTTGKHENKFGVDLNHAKEIFKNAQQHTHLSLSGLHVHLGSPIATPKPYEEAVEILTKLIEALRAQGTPIDVLNIGGGFGVDYGLAAPDEIETFAQRLVPLLRPLVAQGIAIVIEPGRSIICQSGVLLTRVQYVKQSRTKRFIICDAGMHTLLRPALYQAYHFLWPVAPRGEDWVPGSLRDAGTFVGLSACDVVGPICESSDFLAQNRMLPEVQPGDLLAVFCAGAYGMSMTSTYNDHPRPAEVFVDGEEVRVIRPRQSQRELVAPELMLAGIEFGDES